MFRVDHPSKSPHIRSISEKTNLDKYGGRYYILTDEFLKSDEIKNKRKNTRIMRGYDISDDDRSDWELYKIKVRRMTDKVKSELFDNWDGYDYYDNEFIKDNHLKYEPRTKHYPTIDHKISIKYGFDNNIPIYIISDINNLCITKTEINCSKSVRTHRNFKI